MSYEKISFPHDWEIVKSEMRDYLGRAVCRVCAGECFILNKQPVEDDVQSWDSNELLSLSCTELQIRRIMES